MTYHFPDAYYGQNNKIRETLNNLILKVTLFCPSRLSMRTFAHISTFVLCAVPP